MSIEFFGMILGRLGKQLLFTILYYTLLSLWAKWNIIYENWC